jgi:hypothetical protein
MLPAFCFVAGGWDAGKTVRLQGRRGKRQSEIMAGVTIFFTMACILFVNPQSLSAAGDGLAWRIRHRSQCQRHNSIRQNPEEICFLCFGNDPKAAWLKNH